MRTRAEYEADVKGPGKFEGQPPWAPYFYEIMLDDGSDETLFCEEHDGDCECSPVDLFTVTEADHALFPELPIGSRIEVWESSQGRVYTLRAVSK